MRLRVWIGWLLLAAFACGQQDPIENLVVAEGQETTPIQKILESAKTDSPRDTIASFIQLSQRRYNHYLLDEITPEAHAERAHLFNQFEQYFDLSQVPKSIRQKKAVECVVFLREILDRTGIPPLEDIPTQQEMLQSIKDGGPRQWTIPNTPIEIEYISEGPETGHFLFSADTVADLENLYHEVKHFPYQNETAKNYYDYYFLTPTPMLRPWVNQMPDWLSYDIYQQTVYQWLMMGIVLALYVAATMAFARLVSRLSRGHSEEQKALYWLLIPVFFVLGGALAMRLIDEDIFITGQVLRVVSFFIYVAMLCAAIAFIYVLGTVMSDAIARSRRLEKRQFDKTLARLGIRIISLIIIMAMLIEGLHYIGFSVATVVAGASVTGLAVALAAQNTLRNIFGSLMILLDKPFQVGQRVKISGADGDVEEIGLRSTKIRLLNGHMTTIPNDKVADAEIENIGARPYIRRLSSITITYDTPEEKIQEAVEIIRDVLSVPKGHVVEEDMPHPNNCINQPDFPPRVFFNEFNPDSLNILMIYWFHPPAYWDFLEFSQRVNEQIMRRFNQVGIEFAFPKHTLHLAGEKVAPFPKIEAAATATEATQTKAK